MNLNHPAVRVTASIVGAVGGAALVHAMLGTSAIVTTSYLTAVLAMLVWILAHAIGVAVGSALMNIACDKLSDRKCEALGTKLGSAAFTVRGFFTRKG
jgi:hypothetical protein